MINEVWGLSALTLHDSHANLFDVLIARLFTLEETGGGGEMTVGFCDIIGIYMIMEWKQPPPTPPFTFIWSVWMETFLQFSGSQKPAGKQNSLSDTEKIQLFFFIAPEKLKSLCYRVQGAQSAPNHH